MSLLSDEEIDALWLDSKQPRNECPLDFAEALQAAFLAKLQAMDMPEAISVGGSGVFIDVHLPAQLQQVAAQKFAEGYAKGAADQLSAEPSHYLDESGWCHTAARAKFLGFDRTQLTSLYTRKESK